MSKPTAKDLLTNSEDYPKLSQDINNFLEDLDVSYTAPEFLHQYCLLKMQQSGKFEDLLGGIDLG